MKYIPWKNHWTRSRVGAFLTNALQAAVLAGAGLALAAGPEASPTLPFKNLDMEAGTETPAAWEKGAPVAGVEQIWDRATAHGGKASLCLKKTAQRYFPIAAWNQSVALEPATQARKLRVRGWVKAESVTKAIVDVSYRASQPGHGWAVYVGQKKPTDPVATHDWKLYEGTVQVPARVTELTLGLQIYGPGTVWFDDVAAAWVE